jgi:selenocysteine lyase/cysteine desulfurase
VFSTQEHIKSKTEEIRKNIAGLDKKVRLLDGTFRQYTFFDNAASTPSFISVKNKVNEILDYYSAIHRGQGIKSFISTEAFDEAHEIVAKFVNADTNHNIIVFVKNTTEALNKLSYRLCLAPGDVVLSTAMEHHSNDLPWRRNNFVDYIAVDESGRLDLDDLRKKIKQYGKKIKLITATGASNVSGFVNPYYEMAELAHSIGAKFCLDAAQLAPHRKIDMKPYDDPQHIDFLVMSAHKMYAPYGTGVLICPKETFMEGDPEFVGGGMASYVTHFETIWAGLPFKEEAGSPNTIGGIAMAAACKQLEAYSMDYVAEHELELTEYFLRKLEDIPEVELLVETDYERLADKLGVVTFNIKNLHYNYVAGILAHEYGIGVRTGCFCTHPYIAKLLNLEEATIYKLKSDIEHNRRVDLPGAIRVSFGIYNNTEEIDYLIEALRNIISNNVQGDYVCDEATGSFTPKGYEFKLDEYFSYD